MSAPFDDDVPEGHGRAPESGTDDAIELLLADALESRADTVTERPGAWQRFEAVQPEPVSLLRRRPVVSVFAAAAAAVALVLVATTLSKGTEVHTAPATQPTAPSTIPTTQAPVVGPATAPSVVTSPPLPSIRTTDLRNFGYPASLCPAVVTTSGTIALHDGVGGVDPAKYDGTNATGGYGAELVEPIVYGDLTGDGLEDAVVRLHCVFVPGDSTDTHIAVVTMTADGPVVMVTRNEAGVTHTVPTEGGTRPATYSVATATRIEGGLLAVDWNEGYLGPSYSTTVRYLLQGNTLSVASDTGPVAPPSDPGPTIGTAIRDIPLSSLVVPLSNGFICQPQLKALGSLQDVTLPAIGSVSVQSNGADTGATVAVDDIVYGQLTGGVDTDNQEDLVVRLRCSSAGLERSGVLFYRWTPTGPELGMMAFVNYQEPDHPTVSRVAIENGDLVETWSTGDPAHPEEISHRWRWDGSAFGPV